MALFNGWLNRSMTRCSKHDVYGCERCAKEAQEASLYLDLLEELKGFREEAAVYGHPDILYGLNVVIDSFEDVLYEMGGME